MSLNRWNHRCFVRTWICSTLLLLLVSIPLLAQWGEIGGAVREETRAVAFGRVDASTIYAFSGHGTYGVLRTWTVDNGATWEPWEETGVDEFLLWVASDGHPAKVNQVITGEDYGTTPLVLAATSAGDVFRSGDHGSTWNAASGLPSGGVITTLAAHVGGDVLACVSGEEGDTGHGIYLSEDGGATFDLLAPVAGTGRFTDLAFHAMYGGTGAFYACTDSDGVSSGGVYYWDGGGWLDLSGTLPDWGTWFYDFTALEADPSPVVNPPNPDYLWVGDRSGRGLFQYDHDGGTWTQACIDCEAVFSIESAPDYSSAFKHVLIGSDSGLYEALGDLSLCEYRHPRGLAVYEITFDPNWSVMFPGLWLSTSDGIRIHAPGNTFPQPPDNDNMVLFDITKFAPSPESLLDNYVFAFSRRYGVFLSRDGGDTYKLYMPSLQEGTHAADMPVPITDIALSNLFDMNAGACGDDTSKVYISTEGRGIFRSAHGGSHWEDYNLNIPAGDQIIRSLAHSPNTSTIPLFAGSGAAFPAVVYRLDEGGGQWLSASLPETTELETPGSVNTLALPQCHAGSCLEVYAGTDVGLYRSVDGGVNWTFVDIVSSLPDGKVTSLVIHPNYEDPVQRSMYVALEGNLHRLAETPPGSQNWEWEEVGAANGMPELELKALAISPGFAGDATLVAGFDDPFDNTSQGVYRSIDGGATWEPINGMAPNELPYPRILALSFVQTNAGTYRLLCGTRKTMGWYSDNWDTPSSTDVIWQKGGGWESGLTDVRAVVLSPVPLSLGCTPDPSAPSTDVFVGGGMGVSWSNDGGETFRPINQGLWRDTAGNGGCHPIPVNCLYAFINDLGPGGSGTPTPMLLAGTEGEGIFYRYATWIPEYSAWDWTNGLWERSFVGAGVINQFTREATTPLVIRAASDGGVWTSHDGLMTYGESWEPSGLAGNVTDICHGKGIQKRALPEPDAPSGGTTWGTVSGTGVQKGFESTKSLPNPAAVTWYLRNGEGAGSLPDLNVQAVLQLDDDPTYTVLTGTTSTGVYRTADEGEAFWDESNGQLSSGTHSLDIRDFLEVESNGDIFLAMSGSGDGGIFLSADGGKHWVSISEGFSPAHQTLSSIISDGGSPPTYYAGTYSQGSYATTIQPLTAPTVTSLDVTTGSSAGGTTVVISGNDFLCSCPNNYECISPWDEAVASFGGIDATTTSCSATSLTVTTPVHPTGTVDVSVRNPDTRAGTLAGGFEYSDGSEITVELDLVDGDVEVSWTGAGSPTKVYRSPEPDFSSSLFSDDVTSSPYTYEDASGSDGHLYFYRVE